MNTPRKFGSPFGYGYKPDPEEHRYTGAQHAFEPLRAASLPRLVSMRKVTNPIGDQKSTSSCVGWSMARAIYTYHAARGVVLPLPSPMGIYTFARCIDRVPNDDDELGRLNDFGCMPNQAIRGAREWGIVPITEWPFIEKDVNVEPKMHLLKRSTEFKLTGSYKVQERGQERVQRIKQALSKGVPVCFAIEVDDAFENNKGEVVGELEGEGVGWHYLCAIGYEMINGECVITFANSWNTSWGEDGFGQGNEAFIERMQDVIVMQTTWSGE